jgi:hypothetical protein
MYLLFVHTPLRLRRRCAVVVTRGRRASLLPRRRRWAAVEEVGVTAARYSTPLPCRRCSAPCAVVTAPAVRADRAAPPSGLTVLRRRFYAAVATPPLSRRAAVDGDPWPRLLCFTAATAAAAPPSGPPMLLRRHCRRRCRSAVGGCPPPRFRCFAAAAPPSGPPALRRRFCCASAVPLELRHRRYQYRPALPLVSAPPALPSCPHWLIMGCLGAF